MKRPQSGESTEHPNTRIPEWSIKGAVMEGQGLGRFGLDGTTQHVSTLITSGKRRKQQTRSAGRFAKQAPPPRCSTDNNNRRVSRLATRGHFRLVSILNLWSPGLCNLRHSLSISQTWHCTSLFAVACDRNNQNSAKYGWRGETPLVNENIGCLPRLRQPMCQRVRLRVSGCAFTIVRIGDRSHAVPSHEHSALASSTAIVKAPSKKQTHCPRRRTNGGVFSEFPPQILQNYEYFDPVNYHFR